jgi:dehydrogenase/reductase SDR family protein 12
MPFLSRLLSAVYDATLVPSFAAPGYRAREKDWEPAALDVDCTGRTMVVTGANSGLGRSLAESLAARRATVVMVCRSRDKGEQAQREIIAATKNTAVALEIADVGLMADARALTDRLRARFDSLDVLVNNAGVMLDAREVTTEGLERVFATNVLSGFALIRGLAPLLEAAGARRDPARVIHVTSGGMYTQKYDLDDPQFERGKYDGVRAYAQTKRAQVLLNEVWARRFAGGHVTSNAMHPGWAKTPGVERSMPRFDKALSGMLRTPQQGADTALWLAVSEAAKADTGKLFFDRKARHTVWLPGTRSPEGTGERLFELCEALAG